MRIDIITSVPELLTSPLNESILKRAQDKGLVEIVVHNLHDYAHDRRKTTDDYPFGGEAGMVMKCEPVFELVEKLQSERPYDEIIYTSPDGIRYDQHEANRLSTLGKHHHPLRPLQGYRPPHPRTPRNARNLDRRLRAHGRRAGGLHHRRLGRADHPGRHRRRGVGPHGLVPGQPAGAPGLHAAGRVPRLAGPRRAAVGRTSPRSPNGRTNEAYERTKQPAPRPAQRIAAPLRSRTF